MSPPTVLIIDDEPDLCELLGITLLDHLILGEGYYSFADQGWPGG